ncbi:MAG TPA: tetratricopeptide repeat protein, partial [bacterium]|nr:tetratricopeptide repeat protein [bacterium]
MSRVKKISVICGLFLVSVFFAGAGAEESGPGAELLKEANLAWWRGETADAEEKYSGLFKESGNAAAALELAASKRSIGDYPSAIGVYETLLLSTAVPRGLNILIPLAESCYYSHRLEEAETHFREAVNLSTASLHAGFGLGRTLCAQEKWDEAIPVLTRSSVMEPGFPGSFLYLARAYEKKNDPEKAAEYYVKALKLDTHQVEIRFSLGENYETRKSTEEAYRQFHRLENVDSKNALVAARIGSILPMLARKPEEIVPAKKLEKFSSFRLVSRPEKIPKIRIGLNAGPTGRINP